MIQDKSLQTVFNPFKIHQWPTIGDTWPLGLFAPVCSSCSSIYKLEIHCHRSLYQIVKCTLEMLWPCRTFCFKLWVGLPYSYFIVCDKCFQNKTFACQVLFCVVVSVSFVSVPRMLNWFSQFWLYKVQICIIQNNYREQDTWILRPFCRVRCCSAWEWSPNSSSITRCNVRTSVNTGDVSTPIPGTAPVGAV